MSSKQDKGVTIFEVGPRDGLQNEMGELSYQDRCQFIEGLAQAGVRQMEVGAFVHPDRVPKMAVTPQVCDDIRDGKISIPQVSPWFLVPNLAGLERAQKCEAKSIAVFTAASETFVRRNINKSIEESLQEFAEIVRLAHQDGMQVRGYISTAFACPFEGRVKSSETLKLCQALLDMGVFQVSIGDTIGVATPAEVDDLIGSALKKFGADRIAVHFHDTRGTALANALRSYQLGVKVFDSSAGGLGGCPFAPGATGNLATEDLVYLFDGMGVRTGIDLKHMAEVSLALSEKMQRPMASRYVQAYANQCQEPAYQMDW